jgi:hypothetical protein
MNSNSAVHLGLWGGSGKRIFLRAFLLLGAVVFAVTLTELFLVYKGLYPPPPYPIKKPSDYFEEYPPHGFRLKPHIRRSAVFIPGTSGRTSDAREQALESNKNGFRGWREFDEADDRTRIVVLGDSFVFGAGVQQPERFTDVLEQIQPEWRVDNLGMAGFGVDLMLMALEDVGLKLKPDVVVLCIYTDDFPRVRPYYQGEGFSLPRYRLQGDTLSVVPYPAHRPWDSLRLTQLVRRAYWTLTDGDLRLNRAILERFVTLSKQHEFTPLLVLIPGFWEDYPVDVERRKLIEEVAERHRVAFLDASKVLEQVGKKNAYIPGDIHLNPFGHQVLARELRESLLRIKDRRVSGAVDATSRHFR